MFELSGYSEDNPLRVEIRYNTSENHKKIALAIASMWKQLLGVSTTLVNEEFKVFLQNRQQKVITHQMRTLWGGRVPKGPVIAEGGDDAASEIVSTDRIEISTLELMPLEGDESTAQSDKGVTKKLCKWLLTPFEATS